jgi:hypothetical protein
MLTVAASAFLPIVLCIHLAENWTSLCLMDTLQFSWIAGNDKSFAIYAYFKVKHNLYWPLYCILYNFKSFKVFTFIIKKFLTKINSLQGDTSTCSRRSLRTSEWLNQAKAKGTGVLNSPPPTCFVWPAYIFIFWHSSQWKETVKAKIKYLILTLWSSVVTMYHLL